MLHKTCCYSADDFIVQYRPDHILAILDQNYTCCCRSRSYQAIDRSDIDFVFG